MMRGNKYRILCMQKVGKTLATIGLKMAGQGEANFY